MSLKKWCLCFMKCIKIHIRAMTWKLINVACTLAKQVKSFGVRSLESPYLQLGKITRPEMINDTSLGNVQGNRCVYETETFSIFKHFRHKWICRSGHLYSKDQEIRRDTLMIASLETTTKSTKLINTYPDFCFGWKFRFYDDYRKIFSFIFISMCGSISIYERKRKMKRFSSQVL